MVYKLIYTKRSVKDIEKLDIVAKKRLKKALEKFSVNPFFYSQKLIDHRLGDRRFRVGNYQIIFDIKGKTIIVLRVGHRREVYL